MLDNALIKEWRQRAILEANGRWSLLQPIITFGELRGIMPPPVMGIYSLISKEAAGFTHWALPVGEPFEDWKSEQDALIQRIYGFDPGEGLDDQAKRRLRVANLLVLELASSWVYNNSLAYEAFDHKVRPRMVKYAWMYAGLPDKIEKLPVGWEAKALMSVSWREMALAFTLIQ